MPSAPDSATRAAASAGDVSTIRARASGARSALLTTVPLMDPVGMTAAGATFGAGASAPDGWLVDSCVTGAWQRGAAGSHDTAHQPNQQSRNPAREVHRRYHNPMPRRWGLTLAVVLTAACSSARDPISVRENTVYVENQTSGDWRNVVVTVNDHFRGGVAVLAARGRMTAPLSQFQTAYGQRFDIDRLTVVKVEVAATDSSGQAGEARTARRAVNSACGPRLRRASLHQQLQEVVLQPTSRIASLRAPQRGEREPSAAAERVTRDAVGRWGGAPAP